MSVPGETTSTSTDRIEKAVELRAPRSKVWRALTDAKQFGQWFRARLEGTFEPGARISAVSTYAGHEGTPIHFTIETVDAEHTFSWRWRADCDDDKKDPWGEPSTRVTFTLEDTDGGTRLTVVESGFARLPAEQRERVFRENEQGWSLQIENIARHVT